MSKTTIAWTAETWNPVTGCAKVSPGCKFCYATDLHNKRHQAHKAGRLALPQYGKPFSEIQILNDRLDNPEPFKRRKPTMFFVGSMTDLFHADVPDEAIHRVLEIAEQAPRHVFQLLTKRAERLTQFSYPANVWLGITTETQDTLTDRLPHLLATDASVKFLSCEPLLEPLLLPTAGVDWIIVGGEKTTPRHLARPMEPQWARDIRDHCKRSGIAFFLKQMTNEAPVPADLMIREWPQTWREAA